MSERAKRAAEKVREYIDGGGSDCICYAELLRLARESLREWSAEPPTEPGWYWLLSFGDEQEVVTVMDGWDGLKVLKPSDGPHLTTLDYFNQGDHLWCPIPSPPPLPNQGE